MGTLLDNCSTDNYITNSMARKIRLQGEKVQLMVEGIGGEMQEIDSTIYRVPIKDKHGQTHFLDCYGMDMIATQTEPPDASSYKELCSKFGVSGVVLIVWPDGRVTMSMVQLLYMSPALSPVPI